MIEYSPIQVKVQWGLSPDTKYLPSDLMLKLFNYKL